jgi:FkbM family methyltransferase
MGRYRAMDRICRNPPPPFLMRLPSDLGGYFFHCDLRDTISREVCFTGRYEPQETALVRAILRPGMTFVDVGANWGYFTLLAATLVGPNGRVISIEPDPRLFSILEANVTSALLEQVTLTQLAAANEAGTLRLVGYSETGGNFGISRIAAESDEAEQVFQVKSDSLDHVLERQAVLSVDLMKMDIEGAEVFAIPGLEQSLAARKIKRLLLELHPIQLAEHGSTAWAVIEKLQSAGYRAWTIDHSPTATREASYKKEINVHALLRPFDSSSQYDAWPHQLWLAPGID